MDRETKVSMLSGQDMWTLPEVPEIGLPSLTMSDGPVGVRGTGWTEKSIALPSPTALAATWDLALVRKAGLVLGLEARRKGVHVLLAPTINLHRSPRGGRHFECYSEDPLLTGLIANAFIDGVQSQGVAATAKHFVANDSETDRMTANVQVSEQALRELYLLPFEMAVQSGVWAVMAAYNMVNGKTMTEHGELLNGVLKGEWGFDGIVVSDWTAARSTEETALAGLDIVMPQLFSPWGEELAASQVPDEVIDDKVRRVIRLAERVTKPADVTEIDGRQAAREIAARSFVLASNDGVLPLRETQTVALIGVPAHELRIMGGGSAEVNPEYVTTLETALGQKAHLATDPRATLPPAAGPLWTDLTVTCFDAQGTVLLSQPLETAAIRWIGQFPVENLARVEVSGTLSDAPGTHTFSVRGLGAFKLSVDSKVLFDDTIWPDMSDPIGFLKPPEQRVAAIVQGAQQVRLSHDVMTESPFPAINFQLGHVPPQPEDLMEQAIEAAAAADVAVVVVGTTEDVESEGYDRPSLALPGRQDELVSRVIAANPRTVVIVNAGAPVLLPWADEAAAVLLAWFPGQEGGNALADVLYGRAEPGGRLPTTWPRAEQDVPVWDVETTDGLIAYQEELFIGYKAWDRAAVEPLYPFGHGLGYTEWVYETLVATEESVSVTVRNNGTRPGREVIQIYVEPSEQMPARPKRWLAGFAIAEGESGDVVTVTVDLPKRTFQQWADGWQTMPGEYLVHAGHSLADLRIGGVVHVT